MIRVADYEAELTAAVIAAGPVPGWTVSIDDSSGDLIFSTPLPGDEDDTAIVATPFFGDDEAGLHLVEQTAEGDIVRERTVPGVFRGDLDADVAALRDAVRAYADVFSG